MSLLRWIILAACVGGAGLAPGPADAARPPGPRARGVLAPAARPVGGMIRAERPARPGDPAGPAAPMIDFDPESEPDDQARLVFVGDLDRSPAAAPRWDHPAAARAIAPGGVPRLAARTCPFPIRC